MESLFGKVQIAPAIEVFSLNKAYQEDHFPQKVNLGIGAYRDHQGKPWILPVVKKVEQQIVNDPSINHEYLPVLGIDAMSRAAVSLLLGENNSLIKQGQAFGIQGLSGTGSLRIGAEFLSKILKYKTFYVSNPSWGFTNYCEYRYWDEKKHQMDFAGMIEDLSAAPPNSVVILHACAHNPTGMDPSPSQWEQIADVVAERKLFPFFDAAYQGFASGDPDRDAFAVRLFASRDERAGNLTIVLKDNNCVEAVRSQFTLLVRGMYSNPPHHGARIVATILHDQELRKEWYECIKLMSQRIKDLRKQLQQKLQSLKTPGNWDFITQQIGMFSYTGLTSKQVQYLISKYHIYLLSSGRINICGLTPDNLDYVADAFHDAITKFSHVPSDPGVINS